MIFSFIATTFFPIQTENYKGMVKVLFSMYPIEEGIIVFQSIIKVYIFVIGGALTNTIVLQFVQKLKKIDHGQSRQVVI